MKAPSNSSRRQFIKAGVAALGFPTIVPSSVFGANAPSNRITMGVVGWGMMGPGNTRAFLGQPDCQVVAVCDLDQKHLERAVKTINESYQNQDCKAYHDYRELMARKDIDAVMIAVPDHWHALVSVEALKNGKDVYGEKPLARTIAEQQAIVRAVQKYGRIWQTGSQQRSDDRFRRATEFVRNGLIGEIKEVHVGLPSGHKDFAGTQDQSSVVPLPPELDYEFWIGPSQMMDYIPSRVHRNWRWNYNTGAGQLIDWIGHHGDIGHWGMDMDGSGPIEVHPIEAEFPDKNAVWNTATKYRTECQYANGVKMTIAGGYSDIRMGTKWIGSEGWIWVDRGGFETDQKNLRGEVKRREIRDGKDVVIDGFEPEKLGDDVIKIRLYETQGHHRNFLDCVKSRKPTICPVETGHRSAIPGHLSLISMLVNRSIRWDPEKEQILGDDEAAKLLQREYRGDWAKLLQ